MPVTVHPAPANGTSLTQIAEVELAADADPITLAAIPQTYRDLVLVLNGPTTAGAALAELQVNGDTGANYDYQRIDGNGSVSGSASTAQASAAIGFVFDVATVPTSLTVEFTDYTNTSTVKAYRSTSVAGTRMGLFAGRWNGLAAITSLSVFAGGSNLWIAGTVCTLYGRGTS